MTEKFSAVEAARIHVEKQLTRTLRDLYRERDRYSKKFKESVHKDQRGRECTCKACLSQTKTYGEIMWRIDQQIGALLAQLNGDNVSYYLLAENPTKLETQEIEVAWEYDDEDWGGNHAI